MCAVASAQGQPLSSWEKWVYSSGMHIKKKISKQISATNWVSCSLPIESLWNFISVCFRGAKGTSKKQIIVFTELFLCSWAPEGKQWEWIVIWLTDKLLNGPTSQTAAANLGWHLFIVFLSCCSFPLQPPACLASPTRLISAGQSIPRLKMLREEPITNAAPCQEAAAGY